MRGCAASWAGPGAGQDRQIAEPMYAINHAATALLFKKRYPDVRLLWLLLAVQFVEALWVVLNYLGSSAPRSRVGSHGSRTCRTPTRWR